MSARSVTVVGMLVVLAFHRRPRSWCFCGTCPRLFVSVDGGGDDGGGSVV